MKTVFHSADSRGNANHGWLNAKHSFSFASYYNPERVHFGALRVLNDDTIAPGMGFGMHPHDNMEIITIPLKGALEHKDSMGNHGVIKAGDIQVMSAGTGITHSEFNHSKQEEVKLLQIWVFPNQKNVVPRYDQKTFVADQMHNKFLQIISPNPHEEGLWIHQNAWFHIGRFDADLSTSYNWKDPSNSLYLFLIGGSIQVGEYTLQQRDALGIREAQEVKLKMTENSLVLLMEVPG